MRSRTEIKSKYIDRYLFKEYDEISELDKTQEWILAIVWCIGFMLNDIIGCTEIEFMITTIVLTLMNCEYLKLKLIIENKRDTLRKIVLNGVPFVGSIVDAEYKDSKYRFVVKYFDSITGEFKKVKTRPIKKKFKHIDKLSRISQEEVTRKNLKCDLYMTGHEQIAINFVTYDISKFSLNTFDRFGVMIITACIVIIALVILSLH